jgi:hypothetical protein
VARAKKTDRAEARRRARAAAAEAAAASESSPASSSQSATGGGTAQAAGPARPSVLDALRGAARPIDLRGDIGRIPWLVTKTYAVWVPSVLVIAATVLFAVGGGTMQGIPGLAFNLFVFPPPMATAFLAGVLTDRMSYMAGFLVGVVSAVIFGVYVLVAQIPGSTLTLSDRAGYVLYGLVVSPLAGLAIGGFAGFYRRFLRRANPNSGRRQNPPSKGSKAPARR